MIELALLNRKMAFERFADKSGSVILLCLLGAFTTFAAWICLLFTPLNPLFYAEKGGLNWNSGETVSLGIL
jgi:hypothetical protein